MSLHKKQESHHVAASAQPFVDEARTQNDAPKPIVEKKKSTHTVIFLFLLLLVTGLAATATYTVMKLAAASTTPQPTIKQDTAQTTAQDAPDAAAAIASIKTVLTGTSVDTDAPLFALQVPGYDFKTDLNDPSKFTGIKADIPAADSSIKLAEIGKKLKEAGFIEQIAQNNTDIQYEARYSGSKAVCRVSSNGSYDNVKADYKIRVSCANMDSFRGTAELQKPFFVAMQKSTLGVAASAALYGTPSIKASKTPGYSTATMIVGEANVAAGNKTVTFYKGADNTWYALGGMTDVGPGPQCSQFMTDDAKKAFAGETCYNAAVQSVVQ